MGIRRWTLGLSCVPSTIMFIFMIFMPKSVRWLYFQGQIEEAKRILKEVAPMINRKLSPMTIREKRSNYLL